MHLRPLLAALFLAIPTLAQQELPKKLGVKEAVRFALNHSPTFDSEKESKNIAALELTSAQVSFLPVLNSKITYGYGKELLTQTPSYTSGASLTASETLYDNGKSWTQFKIAKLNDELASIRLTKTQEDLSLNIFSAYCDYSKAAYLLEVRQQQFDRLNVQYRSLESQYKQGLRLRRDFLRFQSEVQRSRLTLASSNIAVDESRAQLRKNLGLGKNAPVDFLSISVKSKPISLPVEPLSLEENLSYKMGEIQKQIEAHRVNLVTRDYWPTLSLTGELTYGSSQFWHTGSKFRDNDALNANAGLALTYTFWDWGTKRRDIAIARASERIQGNKIRETLLEAQAELETLRTELVNLKESFDLSRELQQLEDGNYFQLTREYREGKISYLDLASSFDKLLSAKEGFYNSYFSLLLGRARFYLFEGTLYEAIQNDKVL